MAFQVLTARTPPQQYCQRSKRNHDTQCYKQSYSYRRKGKKNHKEWCFWHDSGTTTLWWSSLRSPSVLPGPKATSSAAKAGKHRHMIAKTFWVNSLPGHGWTYLWVRARCFLGFAADRGRVTSSPAAPTANPYYSICPLQKITHSWTFRRGRSSRIQSFIPTEGMCLKQTVKVAKGGWVEGSKAVAL